MERFKPLTGSGDDGFTSLPRKPHAGLPGPNKSADTGLPSSPHHPPGRGRVRKNSARIRACAAIDEVNCMLGLSRAHIKTPPLNRYLADIKDIQQTLVWAGACAAGLDHSKQLRGKTLRIEELTGVVSKKLPDIARFVIPGNSINGALVHCARSSCRTAETLLAGIPGTKPAGIYLNRLSDFLFQLARLADK